MTDQLALASLLADADQRANDRRDLHRGRVQAWFDDLSDAHKQQLGEWMINHEWDTCSSLSIAACDHYLSRKQRGDTKELRSLNPSSKDPESDRIAELCEELRNTTERKMHSTEDAILTDEMNSRRLSELMIGDF